MVTRDERISSHGLEEEEAEDPVAMEHLEDEVEAALVEEEEEVTTAEPGGAMIMITGETPTHWTMMVEEGEAEITETEEEEEEVAITETAEEDTATTLTTDLADNMRTEQTTSSKTSEEMLMETSLVTSSGAMTSLVTSSGAMVRVNSLRDTDQAVATLTGMIRWSQSGQSQVSLRCPLLWSLLAR